MFDKESGCRTYLHEGNSNNDDDYDDDYDEDDDDDNNNNILHMETEGQMYTSNM